MRVSATCLYARVFEPQFERGESLSGLSDWPLPFVSRASHLDGTSIRSGEHFHFDVHMFDVRDPALAYFVLSFAELAREGLGPGRGKADLEAVDQLDMEGVAVTRAFDGKHFQLGPLRTPCELAVETTSEEVERIRVRFVTPTELKGGSRVVGQPEFAVLFGRLRDRISSLR